MLRCLRRRSKPQGFRLGAARFVSGRINAGLVDSVQESRGAKDHDETCDSRPYAAGRDGAPAAPKAAGNDWCRGERWGSDRQGVCDVRQFTVPAGGVLTVNAEPNGGIEVRGESRGDIHILARVVAQAETAGAGQPDRRRGQGHRRTRQGHGGRPAGLGRREGWSVSYRLAVPNVASLALQHDERRHQHPRRRGRHRLQDRQRRRQAGEPLRATSRAARATAASTSISKDRAGRGSASTSRPATAACNLRIPERYSARLETGTVNGRFNIDFPVTVQGRSTAAERRPRRRRRRRFASARTTAA